MALPRCLVGLAVAMAAGAAGSEFKACLQSLAESTTRLGTLPPGSAARDRIAAASDADLDALASHFPATVLEKVCAHAGPLLARWAAGGGNASAGGGRRDAAPQAARREADALGACAWTRECFAPFATAHPKFDAAYPSGGSYDAAVASIGYLITAGADDRTDGDLVGAALIAKIAANAASEAADIACDTDTPVIASAGTCLALRATLKAASLAADAIYDQAAYHDALVDGAEIEAAFENTEALLDGQCDIFEEVRCKCADDSVPKRHRGCNGYDDDCDDAVDECDEDTTVPSADVTRADVECGPPRCFPSAAAAEACVAKFVVSTDDCNTVTTQVAVSGVCLSASAAVTATDVCGNAEAKTVDLCIDGTPPVVSCTLEGGVQDVTIDRAGGPKMFDPALAYTVTDNCGAGAITDVVVEVFSDELDLWSVDAPTALVYSRGVPDSYGVLLRRDAFMSCEAVERACVAGQEADGRVYTVRITATDHAGLTGSAECTVGVRRTPDTPVVGGTPTWRLASSHADPMSGALATSRNVP